MDNIIFKHELPKSIPMNKHYTAKVQGRTIAAEALSKSAVELIIDQMMKRSIPMDYRMKIGIAKVHPKDKYDKIVGRRVATEKLEETGISVLNLIIDDKAIKIRMENEALNIRIVVKKYKDSGKIRTFLADGLDFLDHSDIGW